VLEAVEGRLCLLEVLEVMIVLVVREVKSITILLINQETSS
jgi:hypothetical protein